MKSSELDYELPPELIAQHPADRRDALAAARLRPRHERRAPPPVQRSSPARLRSPRRGQRHASRPGAAAPAARDGWRGRDPAGRGAPATRVGRHRTTVAPTPGRRGARTGRDPGEARRRSVADPSRRHPRRRAAAPAVHHRATRRSRPLPDRLCASHGVGRRADRGSPLHEGAARRARRGEGRRCTSVSTRSVP